MFGSFAMRYGSQPILLKKIESSKAARLLQMLLVAAPEGITKSELIDNLYGWEEQYDPANRNRNLNNVIYRLRNALTAGGLPSDNYVEIADGVVRFGGHLPLETDTRRFEQLVTEAFPAVCGGGISPERLEAAMDVYVGELFPLNSSSQWLFEKSNYYKRLYMRVVNALEEEYQRRHDYMKLLRLYSRVAAIYPYENWQVKQIRCNLDMYRYDEAMAIYNQTMEMYARDMGSPPTMEMQQCFEDMQLQDEYHQHERKDLSGMKTMDTIFMGREGNVIKAIFEKDSVSGAYYCPYPSFIDYCRVLVRNRRRHDPRAMLMFLTLDQNYNKKGASRYMDVLKEAIAKSLRKGDVYTRYGNRHFILMLTDIKKEDCGIVFARIEKTYYEMVPNGDELWYHATMTQELEMAMGGSDGSSLAI